MFCVNCHVHKLIGKASYGISNLTPTPLSSHVLISLPKPSQFWFLNNIDMGWVKEHSYSHNHTTFHHRRNVSLWSLNLIYGISNTNLSLGNYLYLFDSPFISLNDTTICLVVNQDILSVVIHKCNLVSIHQLIVLYSVFEHTLRPLETTNVSSTKYRKENKKVFVKKIKCRKVEPCYGLEYWTDCI